MFVPADASFPEFYYSLEGSDFIIGNRYDRLYFSSENFKFIQFTKKKKKILPDSKIWIIIVCL